MTPISPIILLTRPLGAAERFAGTLADLNAEIVISPVQGIESAEYDIPFDMRGAIFTSRNGVEAVEAEDAPCWCVGSATAQAARSKGWAANSANGDVEDLFRRILADRPDTPLVHFRGEFSRGNLADRLSEAGIETREIVVYRQIGKPLNARAQRVLSGKNPVIVPLFSPRSAGQLVQQGPFKAPLTIVAMSDAVAAEAVALAPERLVVASSPDAASMVAAIKQVTNAAYGIESE